MCNNMYHSRTFHVSNFIGHLLLPYKFPILVDRMLPTTCLMYEIRYNKRSVYLIMYCHTIFRGDRVNTQVAFINANLVLMRI